MASKVWLVYKERHTDKENKMIVLGICDNESTVVELINREFIVTKEDFIRKWGDRAKCENNLNGRADLSATNGYSVDVCVITAEPFLVNKATYNNIWSTEKMSNGIFC